MPLENRIKVDVKTNKDVSGELRKEIEKYDKIRKLERTVEYLLNNIDTYEVTQGRFNEDSELLFTVTIPDEMMPFMKKIEHECATLGDICNGEITEGDTAREEERYVIRQEEYEMLSLDEKSEYRRVIRGGDVKSPIIKWGGDYIRCLRENPQRPRLLIKDISARLTVSYDGGVYRCLRTIYCAYPQDETFDVKYLLGLLNSKLLHFYYIAYFYASQMSPREGNFRFRTQFTKRLPIKRVSRGRQQRVRELVENVMMRKEELSDLKQKVTHFPNSYLESDLKPRKLMNMVKALNLSRESYKISEKFLRGHYFRDLLGAEAYRVFIHKEDYVDFDSQDDADYVLKYLSRCNEITQRELRQLMIPSAEQVRHIMKECDKDNERIQELQKKISELKKKLDHLVYELYDITYKERRTIDEYLAKF